MKIEIDFTLKTIRILDQTTIGELVSKLKDLNIPDWESYKIDSSALYYPYFVPATYPVYPAYPLMPTYEPYKVVC